MLDTLTQRLSHVVKTLRGQARLTEANTQAMLREVRMALLEADVALPVVRDFIAQVQEKALGEAVLQSLSPGQALVGIVHKALTALMGGTLDEETSALSLAVQPPAVILMVGLQGAGKTTTTGKLARWLAEGNLVQNGHKSGKKKVAVVSTDVYRPAAIEQLKTVADQVGVTCLASSPDQTPQAIAHQALEHARRHHFEVLIIDTAGRLGIDEAMMREVQVLHDTVHPVETLFVVDAMQGQDAMNTARAFGQALPLTGIILTKCDGDARGGAALSVRQVTGKPLKFMGVSEKLDGLEPFYPDRMAQRILGMGDIVSLVEQAQKNIDIAEAKKLATKLKTGSRFNLNDFREQLVQIKKMGDMNSLLEKLPVQFREAAGQMPPDQADKQLRRTEGILNSMTPTERLKPELIKASRKRRIAAGSGVSVQEVNRLLAQFEQMQGMIKQMKKGGIGKMMRAMGGIKGLGRFGGAR